MEDRSLLKSVFTSTIGQKIVIALSGLFLVSFVMVHLIGNLTLYIGADIFNAYTYKLESTAPLLYVVELILIAGFVFHFTLAIIVTLKNWKARNVKYSKLTSAGDPSRQNISSKTMIYTGLIILVFTVIHVRMFKYGTYYETTLDGKSVRDLYRLVIEAFQNPAIVVGYVLVMILLGYHLRHGFWSAFQSLGVMNLRLTPIVYTIGVILAIILAVGFLFIPIWVYFFSGGV
jgi:succinate dehydrogenase / fumarate reductase cytochrome b subunit